MRLAEKMLPSKREIWFRGNWEPGILGDVTVPLNFTDSSAVPGIGNMSLVPASFIALMGMGSGRNGDSNVRVM